MKQELGKKLAHRSYLTPSVHVSVDDILLKRYGSETFYELVFDVIHSRSTSQNRNLIAIQLEITLAKETKQ